MKACGRAKEGRKCGTLFEGSGSYCRDCRNDYQRDYYAKKKEPFFKKSTEKIGASCQACSAALRSNTIVVIDTPGLASTVALCETCKAVVTYLSETVDEAAQEFLVDLAIELANLKYEASPKGTTPNTFNTPTYQPTVLQPGSVEDCGACEKPALPGKRFCKEHEDYEEGFHDSYAARLERGEKID